MMKIIGVFLSSLAVVLLAGYVYLLYEMYQDCEARGRVMVRGLWEIKCIEVKP